MQEKNAKGRDPHRRHGCCLAAVLETSQNSACCLFLMPVDGCDTSPQKRFDCLSLVLSEKANVLCNVLYDIM